MFILVSFGILLGWVTPSQITSDKQNEEMTQVQAMVNGVAHLPCDLSAPTESDFVTLIIWYRDEFDFPLYSIDARGRSLEKASHWSEKSYSGRVYFQLSDKMSDGVSRLSLKNLNQTDTGSYKCRVDFKKSPTRNSFVNLTVIVPPSKLTILNEKSEPISRPMVGPFSEGETVTISCLATSGSPPPYLTWWLENTLVDDFEELQSEEQVKNDLVIKELNRGHAGLTYTCQGINNDILPPVTADVRIDMYLKILDVSLVGENLSLSAGSEYEVACQAVGSRPPAVITWWKAGQMLDKTREKASPDGNITVSTLTFTPMIEDLGKSLSCRASNPYVPGSAREDTWTLNVHCDSEWVRENKLIQTGPEFPDESEDPPQVTLTLGSNINESSIREGVDVYFDCSVKANPWIRFVTWKHEGKNLTNNATAGTIIANQTLVLQSVSRQNTGQYTCSATNLEGSAESNSFRLDVKYEPQCRSGQQRIYGAARNEAISIICEVDSNPLATLFRWTFNNSIIKSKEVDFRTSEQGGKSVATYTPSSEQGYGTLLCWGRNELGPQSVPCVFHIVPAGKPDPPKNCALRNKTQTSLHVSCVKGFDGGLPQEFTLEVFDASSAEKPGRLMVNMTRKVVPEFSVGSLEPGGTYMLNVYASNDKGRSSSGVTVKVTTLRPTHQEHRRNMPAPVPTASFLSTMSPLIWLSVGIVSFISVTTILIILILRIRGSAVVCCCDADDEDTQHSNSGAESADDASKHGANTITAKTIAKTFHGDDVVDMDERNPDIIPLTNDVENTSSSDLVEGDPTRNWKNNTDLQFSRTTSQYDQYRNSQMLGNKGNLAYEIPAPIEKWAHQILWPGEQQPSGVSQSQYNIVLNKQNMVFMDPNLNKVHQNPIVLTTLSIDPAMLTPSSDQSQPSADISLNPCILLKQNPEALLATIPENLQVVGQSDKNKFYNTLPSKTRQQNAETQTPLPVRHKESAV